MIPLCTPSDEQAHEIKVSVARTLSDIMETVALRALVYLGEQNCPYEEEFDGNDFAGSTHLIARINGEPVGTLRLRWFADFVKLERVAIKRGERGGAVVTALCQEVAEIASRKGYSRILGHVQVRLAPFWVRHGGAQVRSGRQRFAFSDHEYVEVVRELDPHPDALSMDSAPLLLLRPEGDWDRPGVLDRSASRAATNPAR